MTNEDRIKVREWRNAPVIKPEVVARIVAFKFGFEMPEARSIADDMIRDDFKINGIKTMGGVIEYIDYVRSTMKSAPKDN